MAGATAVVALQPCKTGMLYERRMREDDGNPPEMVLSPALQAFSAALPGAFPEGELGKASKLRASVQTAPECVSAPQ